MGHLMDVGLDLVLGTCLPPRAPDVMSRLPSPYRSRLIGLGTASTSLLPLLLPPGIVAAPEAGTHVREAARSATCLSSSLVASSHLYMVFSQVLLISSLCTMCTLSHVFYQCAMVANVPLGT